MDQAARHDSPELHFLTVVARARPGVEEARRALAELVLPAFEGFDYADWLVRLHVRSGVAHEEIASFASDVRANLIVLGRFGLHHRSGRLGSVASRVLDRASCPTLVIGLVDQAPDSQPQCGACVELRAITDGERWFCDEHAGRDRLSLGGLLG